MGWLPEAEAFSEYTPDWWCSCALVFNSVGMLALIGMAIPTFFSWYCISCFFGGLFMFTAFALHLPSILTHCSIIGKLDRIILSLQ